ncbi:hypothetical protein EV196_103403 [Mariniflexile fucanivorans]|uniref:Tetratricopeptide repeat protein n=1 Tax=Mariniflexile fucanivorans TaxID=264023 RepID=A0A4R1RMF4_9FLAO|nr:hypothetical protein [Mariniflexile fucanivorans]TCL66982.1 hypothetical protein EV196_103403 [Mariniflexile fucanivorans]
MPYYLILILQAYCIYHAYKHGNAYYWYFLILFIPVLGCIIYLITQVYNKRDAEKIQEDIVSVINPTKKIKDLEKRLQFSETYQNRVNLADALLDLKDYKNAIPHYLEALKDGSQSDFYVTEKLVAANYGMEDYNKVIFYAEKIQDQDEFKKSRAQFLYGLALEKLGDFEAAELNLRKIDIRYSFYNERLVLAKFLISRDKTADAKEILEEIKIESQNMTSPNKRLYRTTIHEVEKLIVELK